MDALTHPFIIRDSVIPAMFLFDNIHVLELNHWMERYREDDVFAKAVIAPSVFNEKVFANVF
ncbi:hypothetical protein Pan241w_35600 [Gimesia alba]|uniref:Uncharacterized protein n=1 Tax=Gimesia alba TaxID=2527973 RepID=A0A517RHW5_9PLAN|nr:hypothetical protein [Gimesia alba]QDT43459.1 hypothetical protein Pan241w_35600 [Gimesia alba]